MSGPSSFSLARIAVAIVLSTIVVSCGGRSRFVKPAGTGVAAPDAQVAWNQATSSCRAVDRVVSTLKVSGRIAGTRVPSINIEAAVILNQSIYLSAHASGRPLFLLAGTSSRATLWLRTEDRAVTAAPVDILSALIGVSLSPDDMLGVLSGCVSRDAAFAGAARHGATVAIAISNGTAFLEQRAGQWQMRAFESRNYTVEFVPPGQSIPQDTWVWSTVGTEPASLHLNVQERELNGTIPAEIFRVPAGAQAAAPMSLEELASLWKNRTPTAAHGPRPDPSSNRQD